LIRKLSCVDSERSKRGGVFLRRLFNPHKESAGVGDGLSTQTVCVDGDTLVHALQRYSIQQLDREQHVSLARCFDKAQIH